MSDFEIKSAVRVNTPAFVALAGPSGSGKTRSALELATGLAGDDGKILLADTEGNRGLHYADLYKFDHVEFRPNYTPERCAELIDLAEKHDYAVLVLDSASDEYEGEGGLQEIRDQTNDEFWAKTKARHKHALINRIRRSRIHVIFCLRCEERVKIEKVQGRTVIVPLGWMPICEKRFLYEMQSSFRFDPDHPGVPVPIKLYDIHAQFFPPDRPITRDAGRALAAWAAGAPVPAPQRPIGEDIVDTANSIADKGSKALAAWWNGLERPRPAALSGHLSRLRMRAVQADESAPADTPLSGHKSEAIIGIDDMKSDLHNSQLSAAGKAGGSPVEGVESSHLDTEKSEASADTPPSGAGAAIVPPAVPASFSQELSDGASGRGERAADSVTLAPVQSSEGSAATDAPRGSDNDPPPRTVSATVPASSISAPVREAPETGREGPILAGRTPPPVDDDLAQRLTEAASKGLKHFDRVWVHVLTPEERALAAPMCGHYRDLAVKVVP